MATNTNSLDAWKQTRATLAQNLASTLDFLSTEPFSADPSSAFAKARAQEDRILDEIERLAVAGIKQIDDQIAAGDLVERITDLAKQAEDEANRLKDAVKTIDKITKAVDTATGVVTQITQLPFL
jgi:methionine synthase II (cobalamin-independent)